MILGALIEYYDRLPDAAPLGWSPRRVSFCLTLERDGRLHSCKDLRVQEERGLVPRDLVVPHPGGKRTSGIRPYLLCDKTEYLLGRDGAKESGGEASKIERIGEAFEQCKALHLDFREQIDSPEYKAVCAFLESWDPSKAEELLPWEDVSGTNLVFSIRGQSRFVHDVPAVRDAWDSSLSDTSGPVAPSLIDGVSAPIAVTHLSIKGVLGGKTEQSIVSFNKNAFLSYGKEQGQNAPLGVRDASRYCTVLNALLADNRRRVQVGDATTVFWSEQPHPIEDITGAILAGKEDEGTVRRVEAFLGSLKRGTPDETLENAQTRFFVLGLAPNAARLAVRFWLEGTVGKFAEQLLRHASALEVGGAPEGYSFPSIRRLVEETAPSKGDGWPDGDRVSPVLAGEVARAILGGLPYPRSLLIGVVQRLRAEGFVDSRKRKQWRWAMHRRASILKACLVRGALHFDREIPMTLNEDHPEAAYQLGRLFAVLEKTQEEALSDKLNASVRDRYLGSASATPSTVFPRLWRLHVHHLRKLENVGRRVNLERLVASICSKFESIPTYLPIEGQGLFFLGYYQQRQDLYTKKKGKRSRVGSAVFS